MRDVTFRGVNRSTIALLADGWFIFVKVCWTKKYMLTKPHSCSHLLGHVWTVPLDGLTVHTVEATTGFGSPNSLQNLSNSNTILFCENKNFQLHFLLCFCESCQSFVCSAAAHMRASVSVCPRPSSVTQADLALTAADVPLSSPISANIGECLG